LVGATAGVTLVKERQDIREKALVEIKKRAIQGRHAGTTVRLEKYPLVKSVPYQTELHQAEIAANQLLNQLLLLRVVARLLAHPSVAPALTVDALKDIPIWGDLLALQIPNAAS